MIDIETLKKITLLTKSGHSMDLITDQVGLFSASAFQGVFCFFYLEKYEWQIWRTILWELKAVRTANSSTCSFIYDRECTA